MAGKDGKLESKGGDVVRQGFMIKRSQNKKRFTPVNYKQRWFVLTKHYLIYYDGDGEVSVASESINISFIFYNRKRTRCAIYRFAFLLQVLRYITCMPATVKQTLVHLFGQ